MNGLMRQRRRLHPAAGWLLAALLVRAYVPIGYSFIALAGPLPAPPPAIRILAAWIRWLPAGLPAAGYLTLANIGDEVIYLDGASSPSYREVSIHRSMAEGANVQMLPVKAITLAPHTTLSFESSGYHLMLMDPAASTGSGGKIMITLHFSGGSTLIVPFELRKSADSAPSPPRPAA